MAVPQVVTPTVTVTTTATASPTATCTPSGGLIVSIYNERFCRTPAVGTGGDYTNDSRITLNLPAPRRSRGTCVDLDEDAYSFAFTGFGTATIADNCKVVAYSNQGCLAGNVVRTVDIDGNEDQCW